MLIGYAGSSGSSAAEARGTRVVPGIVADSDTLKLKDAFSAQMAHWSTGKDQNLSRLFVPDKDDFCKLEALGRLTTGMIEINLDGLRYEKSLLSRRRADRP